MQTKWLEYFRDVQKERALKCKVEKPLIDYGDLIYKSSDFLDRRWLVTHYLNEFNVFVEYRSGSNCFERLLAATFKSKDRAIAFAAEMFLICCGKLRRDNRHDLAAVNSQIDSNG
jgi:hypothetical protein